MQWISAAAAKSLQSCLILCDSIDGRPPGSSVPGILQTRVLEWVAMSFSSDFWPKPTEEFPWLTIGLDPRVTVILTNGK